MFFTSGTTGLPKGVLSTHRGWLGNAFNIFYAARRRELRNGTDGAYPVSFFTLILSFLLAPPPFGKGPVPAEPPKQRVSLVSVPLFHVTGCTSQTVRRMRLNTVLCTSYPFLFFPS